MKLALVLFWLLMAALPMTAADRWERLYVFGDSYSDIGEGYLDGDGPTAVAYLAGHLGIVLKPSNQAKTPGDSLDFAVSGAGTGRDPGHKTGAALLGWGMQNQVDDFVGRVRDGRIRFRPDSTLFFVAGGLNDGRLASETTASNLKSEVKAIYAAGGRHFELALLPVKIPAFSAVGKRLNPVLEDLPRQMMSELPGADVKLSHWGMFFDEVMRDGARFGITNTSDACAGRAIFHEDATPCANPAANFYYHAGHPSTAAHKAVGDMLYQEIKRRDSRS